MEVRRHEDEARRGAAAALPRGGQRRPRAAVGRGDRDCQGLLQPGGLRCRQRIAAGDGRHGLQPGGAGRVLPAPLPRLDDRRRLDRDPQEPHRRAHLRAQLFATPRIGKRGQSNFPVTTNRRRCYRKIALTPFQSALPPETFTTSIQRATSSRSWRSNSSGEVPTGSAPCSTSLRRRAGSRAARETPFAKMPTPSRGVAAGASRPNHSGTSTPSTPASFIVGTSGRSSVRFAPATASARRRPERTCWRIATVLEKLSWTSPAISAVSAGALPLYGTCTMLVPVRSLKSSPARCWLPARPAHE